MKIIALDDDIATLFILKNMLTQISEIEIVETLKKQI